MGLISHLHGVYCHRQYKPIAMQTASPNQVLERILILRFFVNEAKIAIQNSSLNQQGVSDLTTLIDIWEEDVEELFDYYVAKVKAIR